jgi:hypothetical protein
MKRRRWGLGVGVGGRSEWDGESGGTGNDDMRKLPCF